MIKPHLTGPRGWEACIACAREPATDSAQLAPREELVNLSRNIYCRIPTSIRNIFVTTCIEIIDNTLKFVKCQLLVILRRNMAEQVMPYMLPCSFYLIWLRFVAQWYLECYLCYHMNKIIRTGIWGPAVHKRILHWKAGSQLCTYGITSDALHFPCSSYLIWLKRRCSMIFGMLSMSSYQ